MSWKLIKELCESRWDDDPYHVDPSDEKRMEDTVHNFNINDFMKDYGSEFLWDERAEYREQSPDDLELTVKDVIGYVDHYLAFAAYGDEDGQTHFGEFEDDAKEIFQNTLLPILQKEGYTFKDLPAAPQPVQKTVTDYDQLIAAKQAEIQKYEANYNPKYDGVLSKMYDELKALKYARIDADNAAGAKNEAFEGELARMCKLAGI